MVNEDIIAWANSMHIVDRSEDLLEIDPLYSFALDELLCKEAHRTGKSFCHLWRHPNAFILGQRDNRLPNASYAVQWLEKQNYMPVVRNSGGAAVPLDLGVVNVSLIFPKSLSANYHFHQDFEKMYSLIREALSFTGLSIEKGEIQGAYCPGDYDLSIAGRKFCGIAQRRQLHAYSIQAFIITSGNGAARTKLVRHFYDLAAFETSAEDYPQVTDESTASLEELAALGKDAARVFVEAIKHTLTQAKTMTTAGINHSVQQQISIILPKPIVIRALATKLRERYTITTP